MVYLLDTNIFIEYRKHYPMDVWTTFWRKLSDLAMEGQVVSSVKVKDEIKDGFDELKEWVLSNVPQGFFLPFDSEALNAYSALQNWAASGNFTDTAKSEFAAKADAYIIATAYSKGMTLVTLEISEPQRRNKVKIPDACMGIGANWCDLNTMFRNLGVTI